MDKRVGVIHEGSLAQYHIRQYKNGQFVARLLSYNGAKEDTPPEELEIHKEGRHWEDHARGCDLPAGCGHRCARPDRPLL